MRRKVWLMHILFWVLFILLGVLMNVALHNAMRVSWSLFWKDLIDPFTPIGYGRTIAVCYLTLYILDQFISRKRYFFAVLSVVIMIVVDVLLRYLIEQQFIGPVFNKWQYPASISAGRYFAENVFFSAMGIFICFLLKIFNDLYRQDRMEKEKNKMELQFLKSQMNPHFLFNTFNNLYGLSLSEPQKTPDAILKLSEILRYMLYESNEELVPLSKEITYLQHMISLQELRYEGDTFIEFSVSGDSKEQMIPPMLLISFVENALKHGDVTDGSNPLLINLLIEPEKLSFYLKNKISYKNKDSVGGIGLKNVQRRLDLMYGNHYELNIKTDDIIFESMLTIDLQPI